MVLPDLITSLLLIALLAFTSVKSFKKGRELWGKESKLREEKTEPFIYNNLYKEND